MISPIVLTPLLLVAIWLVLFLPVISRLLRRSPVEEITSEWLENFSVSAYYPMERLLNDEDFAFLSKQPGFDLSLYRKLRRERLRIFKQYLDRAIIDFNRLHSMIRGIIPRLNTDCSDLVTQLVKIKLRFYFAVLSAELSYYLCLVGFRSLTVRSLIIQLEEMNSQFGLVAAQAS